jgi:hypothetical protein
VELRLAALRSRGVRVSIGQSWSSRCCFATVARRTGVGDQLDLGHGLSFGSPSLRRWLLDPEAGGHHGGGFGGC